MLPAPPVFGTRYSQPLFPSPVGRLHSHKPNDSANTSEQWDSSTVTSVFAEAFGFITSEQLESTAVTGVPAEVKAIDICMEIGEKEDCDDDSSDDDSYGGYNDREPFTEIYPESDLVYFKLKYPDTEMEEEEL